ncbi:hypothetical protein AU381_21330 [Sinorhizobium glycinis]|uniref:Uncharacterized protein n=1 Tax=Sinorhizobium glycinis TaxID=1472378 RepID=A0A178XS90_9HYPH|nr:hypothetical protein AU381_21330 [Sinorhizobium glycinis]
MAPNFSDVMLPARDPLVSRVKTCARILGSWPRMTEQEGKAVPVGSRQRTAADERSIGENGAN